VEAGATIKSSFFWSMPMSNITISLDDQLLKQARVRVAQQGTSLSAKVRELLQQYVNGTDDATMRLREEATANLMLAIESATLATPAPQALEGAARHSTLREELYAGDFRANDRKLPAVASNPAQQVKT
jgi:plasmid stability protein